MWRQARNKRKCYTESRGVAMTAGRHGRDSIARRCAQEKMMQCSRGQLAQALSDSRVSGCYTRARVWNFPSGTAAQRGSPVATNGGGEGAAAQTCAKTDQPVICAHTKHVGVTHHGVQQTAMIPDDAGVPVEPDVYPIAA
jgi:hypothetical protein